MLVRRVLPLLLAMTLPLVAEALEEQRPRSMVSPLFHTPAWRTIQVAGHLIRGGDSTLLVTVKDWGHVYQKQGHGPVYEYDPRTDQLREVPAEAWEQAPGDIADCHRQPSLSALRLDEQAGTLFYRDRVLPTNGRVALTVTVSPSQRRVAVLSAEGPKIRALMPFLGGAANARGVHYHELVHLPELTVEEGSRVRVPLTTRHQAFIGCWSADERFVVYTSVLYQELCVIRIDPPVVAQP